MNTMCDGEALKSYKAHWV